MKQYRPDSNPNQAADDDIDLYNEELDDQLTDPEDIITYPDEIFDCYGD